MVRDSGNIIVYVDDNGQPQVDVRFQDETVWLTQAKLLNLDFIARVCYYEYASPRVGFSSAGLFVIAEGHNV